MSDTLFTPNTADTNGTLDQENHNEVDENKNYFEELVGEGKKYKDEAALAKGAAHANSHIAKLEAEQAELRVELAKRLTLEDAVAKMTEQASQQKVPSNEPSNTNDEVVNQNANVSEIKPGMTAEEIQALIDSKITEKEQHRTQLSNMETVRQELQKTWGNAYTRVLSEKVNDLGVSQDFLDSLAASHPKAFLELVGVKSAEKGHVGNVAPPASQVNSNVGNASSGNVRDQAYYRNLRRTDPNTYWSAKVQSQIHKDADALGDKFFT